MSKIGVMGGMRSKVNVLVSRIGVTPDEKTIEIEFQGDNFAATLTLSNADAERLAARILATTKGERRGEG